MMVRIASVLDCTSCTYIITFLLSLFRDFFFVVVKIVTVINTSTLLQVVYV